MSLILHPSVHFVCAAQDTPLAENAHLTTRLGSSLGKEAFRGLIGGAYQLHKDLGSSRTASASSQMKRKALTKAVLLERPKMPPYKEGLFGYLLPVPSEHYHLYGNRERERKRRLNEMSLEEGINHQHTMGPGYVSVHFSLERLLHLVTPSRELPFCSIAAPAWSRGAEGPPACTTKHHGDFLTVLG